MRRLLLVCLALAACGGKGDGGPVLPPQPALPPLGPQTIDPAVYVAPGDNVRVHDGTVWTNDGPVWDSDATTPVFRQDADIDWHSLVWNGQFIRYAWYHMVLPKHGYVDVVVADRYDAPSLDWSTHLERTFWAEHVGLAAVYRFGPGVSIESHCFHMGGLVRGPTLALRINQCELR